MINHQEIERRHAALLKTGLFSIYNPNPHYWIKLTGTKYVFGIGAGLWAIEPSKRPNDKQEIVGLDEILNELSKEDRRVLIYNLDILTVEVKDVDCEEDRSN